MKMELPARKYQISTNVNFECVIHVTCAPINYNVNKSSAHPIRSAIKPIGDFTETRFVFLWENSGGLWGKLRPALGVYAGN